MAEQPFDEQTQEPEEPLDEQPFDEQAFKEYLRGVLKDTNPVITKLADLPSVWRDTPAGEPDPDHPGFPNRTALLDSYIGMADTQPPAREGLRSLLREMRESGEDVPTPLVWWAVDQFVQGDPPPKRGRPEEADRDFRVWVVYGLLRGIGYSQEGAIGYIADLRCSVPETVRSIIRKLERDIREFEQGIQPR